MSASSLAGNGGRGASPIRGPAAVQDANHGPAPAWGDGRSLEFEASASIQGASSAVVLERTLEDGLHTNRASHERIAANLADALGAILDGLASTQR